MARSVKMEIDTMWKSLSAQVLESTASLSSPLLSPQSQEVVASLRAKLEAAEGE